MAKRIVTIAWAALALGVLALVPAREARASGWVMGTACTDPSHCRDYNLWVPASYTGSTPVPLLLVLHGCTQNSMDMAAGTQWNAYADARNFLAVYPDQPSSANGSKCWNWFLPEDQARGSGEPAILAQVIAQVRGAYNINAQRMYVTGMSAGAAMTVIMAATYPDLFQAAGPHSGLEYKAGSDLTSALAAQAAGGPDPNVQGLLAYQAMGTYKHRLPVIVFQGDIDTTVAPVNGDQIISQWAQTNDLVDDGLDNGSVDNTADSVRNGMVALGHPYTVSVYNDGAGKPLLEKWIVHGMGHAYSGGSLAGSFTDPLGPSATQEMCRFFQLCPGAGYTLYMPVVSSQ